MLKKSLMIVLVCCICLFSVTGLSSCKSNQGESSTDPGYQYTPSVNDTTVSSSGGENTSDSQGNYTKTFSVDESWQKNYSVSYVFFNAEQSIITRHYTEKKFNDAFIIDDRDSGALQYYKANGNDTDCYIIIDGSDEQAHDLLKDQNFESLKSFFMRLSQVDPGMTVEQNVLYIGTENIAGRLCYKYVQGEYKNADRQQLAYLWVDSEFGFAAKFESFDSDGQLKLKWEITEFSNGNMTQEDVNIDLSVYTFKEAE